MSVSTSPIPAPSPSKRGSGKQNALEDSFKKDCGSCLAFDTVEMSPISSSERQYLRSKKYYSRKRHANASTDNNNNNRDSHDQSKLLTIMDNDDELTSFPLAPPPSNSISNMDQILNDTSHIDISFEVNTSAPANNNNIPNKIEVDDPKLKITRKDPIVLIEDYISNENIASTSQSLLAKKKSSVYTLRKSLLDLKSGMSPSYNFGSPLNTTNSTIPEDSFRVTYTSIQSLKSFNSIKKQKSLKNKSSLQYLNNAISLLQNTKRSQPNYPKNTSMLISQALNAKQPSVSSSDTINPGSISSQNPNNPNVSSLANSATSSQRTAVLPEEKMQLDGDYADDENNNYAIETSSRNNSFTSLNNHSHFSLNAAAAPKLSKNLLSCSQEGSLKYCTICDKPLYDLSSLISNDKVFKVFVCDNCTSLYNDIVYLLDKFFLEIDIASNPLTTTTHNDSAEYPLDDSNDVSIVDKNKSGAQLSCFDEDSFDEDEQLQHLAKFVANELGDYNNANGDDSFKKDVPDVAIYEKLLKLLLLVMHNHQNSAIEEKPDAEEEDDAVYHTTTDIGDDSVHTLSLHPEAGFSLQEDTSNILDALFEDEVSTSSPTEEKEEQHFMFNTSFSDINNKGNSKNHQTSEITPHTENIHSASNNNNGYDNNGNYSITNTKLKFSDTLIGLLHDQLAVYDTRDSPKPARSATVTRFKDFTFTRKYPLNSGVSSNGHTEFLNGVSSIDWGTHKRSMEEEWTKLRKTVRWRWRIKGLLPGLDPVDRNSCPP